MIKIKAKKAIKINADSDSSTPDGSELFICGIIDLIEADKPEELKGIDMCFRYKEGISKPIFISSYSFKDLSEETYEIEVPDEFFKEVIKIQKELPIKFYD